MNKKIKEKRNPAVELEISLHIAKDTFKKLCEISKKVELINKDPRSCIDETSYEEFKNLKTIRRALWTSLIIEIGRLFDNDSKNSKKVISFRAIDFFKEQPFKKTIDSIYGNTIISKIRDTRHTYIAHRGVEKTDVLSADEICRSCLGDLLNKLDEPLKQFKK